ncbi:hypothetical protein F8M41_022904 [Gigaspora margarita]|uniref:Uncharacterized protein n=1 Tax=Gigaspora margarita TaxID=4874 RepID=A0A8H4EHQ2_GIGMA|nr:hypothetical protein F8M41_022904 [Gigaspora margarita]
MFEPILNEFLDYIPYKEKLVDAIFTIDVLWANVPVHFILVFPCVWVRLGKVDSILSKRPRRYLELIHDTFIGWNVNLS